MTTVARRGPMEHGYRDCKSSDVTWLGEVPGHWTRQRLKYLVHFVSGGTPVTARLDYWGGTIPWASPKDMKSLKLTDTEDHITETALVESATAAVSESTVLLVVRSGILRHTIPVAVTGSRMAINQDIKGLVPKNGQIHPTYLARFVEGHSPELLREWRKEGTTVESLELPLVANFAMVVPPLDEQRAIVLFLDRETARIDALIEKKRRQIELLHEKRAALIGHAVTKGLDPNTPMKDSGVEWLGEVPEHWDVWKVTHAFEQLGSGTTPRSDDLTFYGGGIPWVTTSELRETEITDTASKLTDAALREHSALQMYPVGTLLFAMYGATIGRMGILGIPTTVNQACAAFVRPRHLDPRFTFYWLQMRRPTLIALSVGGGQPNLSQDDLRQLRIPAPSVDEQRAIVDFLDNAISMIDALVAKINLSIDRLREYRTAIISAAVTGKIDMRREVTT